jgi:hypothetical protein
LLGDAGFTIATHDAIILQREFADLRAQIMALPFEKDMRKKGEEAMGNVVAHVAQALAPYEQDSVFVVPQEAHFFSAIRT